MSRESLSDALQACGRDVQTFATTLTPAEAIGIAGMTSGAMFNLLLHADGLPGRTVWLTSLVHSEVVRLMCVRAVRELGPPEVAVYDDMRRLMDRLIADINKAASA